MRRISRALRHQLTYFLIGFVIAFIIYLLVRYDFDDIVLGAVIGAAGGVGLVVVAAYLERRYPDTPTVPPDQR